MALLAGRALRQCLTARQQMLSSCARHFAAAAEPAPEDQDNKEVTVTVNKYRGHNLEQLPGCEVQTNRQAISGTSGLFLKVHRT